MAVVGMMTVANAQRPVDANPFSLEGGLNLTGGNTFSAPAITFRYFAAENIAARVGLMYSSSKTLDNYYGFVVDPVTFIASQSADSLGTREAKSSMTWFSIGGSYHFSQLEKLSPYAALDIMFGSGSSNENWKDYDGSGFSKGTSATINTSESGFGFKLSAGFDYYFAENVFIGAELGFMSMSSKDKGGEASSTFGATTVTTKILPQGNSSNFYNSATSAIRLGWRF